MGAAVAPGYEARGGSELFKSVSQKRWAAPLFQKNVVQSVRSRRAAIDSVFKAASIPGRFSRTVLLIAVLGVLLFSKRRLPSEALVARSPIKTSQPLRDIRLTDSPAVFFWAWDRPEDLRFLNPQHEAVAYLAGEVYLHSNRFEVILRRNPLLIKSGIRSIAVIRLEHFEATALMLKPEQIAAMSQAIIELAHTRPETLEGIQIDFDARKSERLFYGELLQQIRRDMPRKETLSITALASWCSFDPWIRRLPVDEAVPMLFRMGRRRGDNDSLSESTLQTKVPICQGSMGISTDEPHPDLHLRGRVYIFDPNRWTEAEVSNIEQEIHR